MADVRRRLGQLSFGLAAAAMIATPLARRGHRAVLANVVVGALGGVTASAAARRWGGRRAMVALTTITATTAAVEKVGTTTGKPFGPYDYAGALQPQLAGVPAAVPVAWFAMALPAREVAHAVLGRHSSAGTRTVVGAACLTAWDLFLDPQMTSEGYWRWLKPGRYRGIPGSNFAGWFATGLGVMALLELVVPAQAEPDATLVAEYGWMAVMQTLGFAVFFRDPVVAAVGGAAMLPPAFVAARRVLRASRG